MQHNKSAERIPHPREHLYIACSTVCNLGCKICPYRKNVLSKRIMTNELFATTVEQACAIGFESFGLTPLIGEVFTDPQFARKLSFLESYERVESYSFTTNFTLADPRFIERLSHLKKLRYMSISVYGHDESTFIDAASSDGRTWQRLLDNLSLLAEVLPAEPVRVLVRIRSASSVGLEDCRPELQNVLDSLARKNVQVKFPQHYYNWGGLITDEDIADFDVEFLQQLQPKRGPCAMIFYKTIVLPDGRVNACACRDAAATLVIGDLTTQSLAEIYSSRNPVYRRLIERQCNGDYGPVCGSCNMYRSISGTHVTYEGHRKPAIALSDFFEHY